MNNEPSWIQLFIHNHGERLFFMGIATAFGIVFHKMGMAEEGKVILIAVGTLALNKARGTLNGKKGEG